MKESKIRTVETIKANAKKTAFAIGTAVTTASAFAPMMFAATSGGATASSIISTFLGYVVDMFLCVGVLLGVWAIAQLALSFKNEDADSKSRAMMMLVVACVLIGIKPLATTVVSSVSGITIGKGFLNMMSGLPM